MTRIGPPQIAGFADPAPIAGPLGPQKPQDVSGQPAPQCADPASQAHGFSAAASQAHGFSAAASRTRGFSASADLQIGSDLAAASLTPAATPHVHACACGAHAALKTCAASAKADSPVVYTVRIPEPASGYVEVTARIPTDGKASLGLMLPVWTPGSYKVRDFAGNIDADMTATDDKGRALTIDKPEPSRWTVATQGARFINVRYRVYAHTELSVRTNWVEPGLALLNGAATFITLDDGKQRPHIVDLPPTLGLPATGLPEHRGNPFKRIAADYDTLVDGPIVLGANDRRVFDVDGTRYTLATYGSDDLWDSARAARDLKLVLRELHAVWGQVPFTDYTILNLLCEGGGGLEHKNSTTIMGSRWSMKTRDDYLSWLQLNAHEITHAWNVKRLRPVELGPFDYAKANPTAGLWIAEGFTAYYEKLLVRRSGLMTEPEYLKRVSSVLAAVQNPPGNKVQTLCQSSQDAYIKYYQPTENSVNTTVSYYDKGAVVALLLDAEIRAATQGAKSLDDVMRTAYARYAGETGYTVPQFEAVASEVAGKDLSAFFDRCVRSTEPLPIDEGLAKIGLRLASVAKADNAYLGVSTRLDGHRGVVSRVLAGTPAAAKLMVGDEILAIDGYRVPPGELDARLTKYRPGDRITILVARRDKTSEVTVTLGEPPRTAWTLERDPDASPETVALRDAWQGSIAP